MKTTRPKTLNTNPLLNLGDDCSSPAHTPMAQIKRPIIKTVMNVDCMSLKTVLRNPFIRSNKFSTSFFYLTQPYYSCHIFGNENSLKNYGYYLLFYKFKKVYISSDCYLITR